MSYSAHVDTFARDNLPPRDQWPDLIFTIPEVQYPERLNCMAELLDEHVRRGQGDRPAIYSADGVLTYAQLQAQVDRVAHVLTHDMGLVPGNRVLLRGANNAMMAICWCAVAKAGLIVVATMPLLREKELVDIIEKAQVSAAICDRRLDAELLAAQRRCPVLQQIVYFNDPSPEGLEARMAAWDEPFSAVDTAADDTVLIAFTSGSTGQPKATMHFHRDILAICDCFPRSILHMIADDIGIGTPPLAFTFGLGALLLFSMRVGGATVLLEQLTPEKLLAAAGDYRSSIARWRTLLTGLTSRRCSRAFPRARRCRFQRAHCGATRRAWRLLTALAQPRCCTSSSPRPARMSAQAPQARRSRATRRLSSTITASSCRPARSAGWP
jgi:2-aminobenzoate-CoA ligase